MIAIAPVYIQLTHRFIANVGPKSRKAISRDTEIPVAELDHFDETKELAPEKIMRLWSLLFPDQTFLEANSMMDELGFE